MDLKHKLGIFRISKCMVTALLFIVIITAVCFSSTGYRKNMKDHATRWSLPYPPFMGTCPPMLSQLESKMSFHGPRLSEVCRCGIDGVHSELNPDQILYKNIAGKRIRGYKKRLPSVIMIGAKKSSTSKEIYVLHSLAKKRGWEEKTNMSKCMCECAREKYITLNKILLEVGQTGLKNESHLVKLLVT